MNDEKYMSLALELAEKGCGFVNPNPMVGAVIVKNNEIIGQGYHEKYGSLHAERNALANCVISPQGAIIYVTLEPCCHYGKTPPCTQAIIQSGIKKVVIGSHDPNPLVSGKGISILRENGIEVVTGVLQKECDKLNEVFFHYIRTKTPFVIMKYAMTMDGKIATVTGKSKWITGEPARERVHHDRHRYAAIMVGVGTVLADDPLLTCRIKNSRSPLRIVCDTNLSTPITAKIVTSTEIADTIIFTACPDADRHQPYLDSGCEITVVPKNDKSIDLKAVIQKLGERNIDSILLEGGAALNFSALQSRIVNKVQTYIAPKIFGGEHAKTPVGGTGVFEVKDGFKLKNQQITLLGEDILIESEVEYVCLQE